MMYVPRFAGPLALLLVVVAGAVGLACGGGRRADAEGRRGVTTAQAPELPSGWTPKVTQYADRDMVAAANPLAVDAGVEILRAGGSALDAAIAVQMVLTLVEPQSSGIGGGAFLMHYDPRSGEIAAYDGRETSPRGATPDMFLDTEGRPRDFLQVVDGGLSVGTPGVVRLLELAHQTHGTLPWSAPFQPAIRLAEQGFAISPRLYSVMAGSAARICRQPAAAAYFLDPGTCEPKAEGSLLRNPELAATFRAIAEEGARAFYTGEIARAIVAAVREHPTNPGRLSLDDLEQYRPVVRTPLCGWYRGLRVCGMPPPSSGTVAILQTLGILERFALDRYDPNSVEAVHLVAEAYRLAYADRAKYVADADFAAVPVAGLLDPAYLDSRRALIRMDRSMGAAGAGTPPGASGWGMDASLSLPSTSHLAVVDGEGRMVNMTTTVEHGFGSLQLVRGFLLNNELTDFSLAPSDADGRPVANRVEPGKRPRSSMAPIIVLNARGEVEAMVGAAGGTAIIQYVTRALLGLIDWGLDVQQALDQPHFGAETSAATTLERGSPLARLEPALTARGHQVGLSAMTSGLQAIVFNGRRASGEPGSFARAPDRGRWAGGADPRREGTARGSDTR